MVAQQRNEFFDEVRAILALFVILIHAGTAGRGFLQSGLFNGNFVFTLVTTQIYICAVPIFIILLGYFAPYVNKPATAAVLSRRLSRLLIPYAIWSLVHIALNYQGVPSSILQLATGRAADPYYFVFVAVCIYLFEYVVFRLNLNLRAIYIFSVIVTIAHIVISYVVHTKYPDMSWKWFMFPPTAWLLYYAAGLYFRASDIRLPKIALGAVVLAVVAASAEGMILATTLGQNSGAFDPVRFTTLVYSILLFGCMLSFGKGAAVYKPLVWAGQVSYGIYLTHDLFLLRWMHLLDWINADLRPMQPIFQLGAGLLTLLTTLVLAALSQRLLGRDASRRILGF